MAIFAHRYDLPDGTELNGDLAIDTETMGLNPMRDRLCVVQLSVGNGDAHLVHFPEPRFDAPNLRRVLSHPQSVKILHFARFDIVALQRYLGLTVGPIFCTKIASKLVRTYTDRHGLKDLCKELLDLELSKEQQSSDWGAAQLSDAQQYYAAQDVLHLHNLKAILAAMLAREGRSELAARCFEFLPVRGQLDSAGWEDVDIFAH